MVRYRTQERELSRQQVIDRKGGDSLSIRVVDGDVQFATHVITDGEQEYFAFNDRELFEIKSQLLEGVNWTQRLLSHSKSKQDKANGIRYNSRSEAIDHIENGKIPEHVKQKKIEKENVDLKARLERLEKLLLRGGQ